MYNSIKQCRYELETYLTNKGYKVITNYRLKDSGEIVDAAAVKDGHTMIIIIGRKYPRKRRLATLTRIKNADNRVFLTREGRKTNQKLMANVDIVDIQMNEPLNSRGKNTNDDDFEDYEADFSEMMDSEPKRTEPINQSILKGYDPDWRRKLEPGYTITDN